MEKLQLEKERKRKHNKQKTPLDFTLKMHIPLVLLHQIQKYQNTHKRH